MAMKCMFAGDVWVATGNCVFGGLGIGIGRCWIFPRRGLKGDWDGWEYIGVYLRDLMGEEGSGGVRG